MLAVVFRDFHRPFGNVIEIIIMFNIFKKHECGEQNHKFQARYSYGKAKEYESEGVSVESMIRILEASRPQTYECDICVRCGKVVDKINKE